MKCQSSSCCFSIAAGNSNYFTIAFKPESQFYFTDDLHSFSPDFFYQFILFRNSRTLHYFISIPDFFFRMAPFFKFNTGCLQLIAINLFQRTFIGKEYIISLLLGEQRSTHTTFTATQYDDSLTHCFQFTVYGVWFFTSISFQNCTTIWSGLYSVS